MGLLSDFTAYVDSLKRRGANTAQETNYSPTGLLNIGPIDKAGFAIDTSRPMIDNNDGSFSTERTITVGMDGRHYNIPTIWDGKEVSEDEAISKARAAIKNGKVFPNFSTLQQALLEARARSEEIGRTRRPEAE